MKKKSDKFNSNLLLNDQIITSAREMFNYFTNFFTSVAVKINKNIAK